MHYKKKDGGIRPIAVGSVLRRLAAKVACFKIREEMSAYLHPHQLGFGTKFGCEVGIHSSRKFILDPNNVGKVLLKIDFKNAFNSIERDTMLSRVKDKIPSVYGFLWQCYRKPSHLFYGNRLISSQTGCMQGDPFGPLLFSLTIQPLIEVLQSEFNMWYLDDGTIGGIPGHVLDDFSRIISVAKDFGLEVNPNKCEIHFLNDYLDNTVFENFMMIAPGIRVVEAPALEILGSPLLMVAVEAHACKKFEALNILSERIKLLQAHYAYFL